MRLTVFGREVVDGRCGGHDVGFEGGGGDAIELDDAIFVYVSVEEMLGLLKCFTESLGCRDRCEV